MSYIYRSKPSTIEAIQWTGEPKPELFEFLRGNATYGWSDKGELRVLAGKGGAQGMVPVPVGHWIVRNPGDHTDYWPVDPDYFALKYEPAEGDRMDEHCQKGNHVWMPREPDGDDEWECVICGDKPLAGPKATS